MNKFHLLVAILATVLYTTDTLATTNNPDDSVTTMFRSVDWKIGNKRQLRGGEEATSSTTNAEERGGLLSALSSIKSGTKRLSKEVGKEIKTQWWVETGRKDEEVRKILKLDGLSGATLTNHKNYRTYQRFRHKSSGRIMDDMVYDGVSTYKVWESLQLDRIPADVMKSTENYKLYTRYVNKYDDEILEHKGTIFEPKIHYGSKSDAELMMKVEIWAEAGRKRWYVKEMLLLDGLHGNKLLSEVNYKYLKHFDQLTEKAKLAKTEAKQ